MSMAEEVFKAAWAERDEQWQETFEDTTGYGQFAPTEPSQRVQAGLEAVSLLVLDKANELTDEQLTLEFAQGIIFAVRVLRGAVSNR